MVICDKIDGITIISYSPFPMLYIKQVHFNQYESNLDEKYFGICTNKEWVYKDIFVKKLLKREKFIQKYVTQNITLWSLSSCHTLSTFVKRSNL